MALLRLLIVALYPVCLLLVLGKRAREAAAAARSAGARPERQVWAQSPRRLRVLVLIAIALALTFAGRAGVALGLVFALLTAPLAASGTLRLLTVTSAGLIVDAELIPWSSLSGWMVDRATAQLVLLQHDPGRAPIALKLLPAQLASLAAALSSHLPEIRPP